MISMKILSTAAALALVLPMAAPVASYAAQGQKFGRAAGGAPAFRAGGGAGPRMGGGAPAARFGGGAPAARFAATAPAARFNGGGGVYRGQYAGGYRRDGGRGFIPGAAVAGAVIGGAIAANNAYDYYGGPGYYSGPAYYDDQYADDGAVAVVPGPVGDDSVSYCMQRYRSYDPASQTYLGNDGYRHPCP
jgi:BA14K-like protein